MKKINYILFDLDGTLLDSLLDLQSSLNYMLRRYNMPERNLDQVRDAVGNGLGVLVKKSLPYDVSEQQFSEMLEDFKAYYRAHAYDRTKPYEGVLDMLAQLKKQGVHMACVTNKPQEAADVLYNKYFADTLSFMQGENPPMPRKPDSAPIFAALKKLGASADECVYVGDSEVDKSTADNSGLSCILCTWGFRGKEKCVELSPEYIAERPNDIVKIVCGGNV